MSLLSLITSKPLKTAAAICLSAVTSALFSIAAAEPGFRTIDIGHAHLNVAEWLPADSRDELVLALPGSGGDYSRYQRLAPLLAEAGYHTIVINQRGIMGSSGNLEGLTLSDLAADVIAIADTLQAEKFHMMGWAFGNRTSRMLATDYPNRVASLTLIAAGGLVPALTQPGELSRLLGEADLPLAEKIRLARRTLFSPATDDSLLQDYAMNLRYWPDARRAQRNANLNTPVEQWSAGGEGPVLMVMGQDDLTAPVENGHLMKQRHGERLELVIIPEAGHVVGLEKPHEALAAIVSFLARNPAH